MDFKLNCLRSSLVGISLFVCSQFALAHGDVVPQAVDTSELEQLGEEWRETNPYRGNDKAIALGAGAYNQNCARCHGLEAKSGGIAPDLRALEPGDDGDEWFQYRVRNGATRNGIPYMPKFEGILTQEALWAIRAWLETQYDPDV